MQVIRRVASEVVAVARHAPFTLTYGAILVATSTARHVWPQEVKQAIAYASTNVTNMSNHPVPSLILSAIFVDGSILPVIPFGLVPMADSERRLGTKRTFAVFVAGHVGGTVITDEILRRGLRTGYYDDDVRKIVDVGMSYGALAVRFDAITALPTARQMSVDAVVASTFLAAAAPWRIPRDFVATGHTVAAAIGLASGSARLIRRAVLSRVRSD